MRINFKKYAFYLLAGFSLLTILAPISYGKCPPRESNRIDQFEVKTFLSVQDCDENAQGSQTQSYLNDTTNGPAVALILSTIVFLTKVAGSIAFLIIVVAGIMLIAGREEEMNKAKDMISAAVIGLILLFAAYIIVIFVQSLFM